MCITWNCTTEKKTSEEKEKLPRFRRKHRFLNSVWDEYMISQCPVILAFVKRLKQFQRKPRKFSEPSTGFERPMTSSWNCFSCFITTRITFTSILCRMEVGGIPSNAIFSYANVHYANVHCKCKSSLNNLFNNYLSLSHTETDYLQGGFSEWQND